MKSKVGLPQVLVTGRLWLGADGSCSIGSAIGDILKEAQQEVIIVAYRLTTGVPEFITLLESALARGCLVRIIRDHAVDVVASEDRYMDKLLQNYRTISVWDFREPNSPNSNYALHAKMVIVDRSKAIVGSANFSRNGMVENHEIAICLTGSEVRSLGVTCDRLIENGVKEGVLIQRKKYES